MRIKEIIHQIREDRAQTKAEPNVSAGNRPPIKNRRVKKRRPYMGPVLMTFELPPKQILLDQDVELEQKPPKK